MNELIVSWTLPPGQVEKFFVIVKDVKSSGEQAKSTDSTSPVIFTGLRPGREFIVTVITSSGPFNVTSDNVQGITVPSTPGSIHVTNFNTSSISLDWGEPADMDFGSYTFNVTYQDGSSTESMTADINSTTISNLISGTKYTISVATIGPGQLQSDFVSTAHFTKPVQIPQDNITVNGNVNELIVSWTLPPGQVEKFFVIVKDVKSSGEQANSTDSTSPVTFTGLRPGREYIVTVITSSGPFNVTSDNVQGITVPSTPGSIRVTNFNTSSISLDWGEPADMDFGSYTFNVTYQDGSSTKSMTADINSTTILNLISGTEHTISVATIGPGQLQSKFVSTAHFTKPVQIPQDNITVNGNVNELIVSWTLPPGQVEKFFVIVKDVKSSGEQANSTDSTLPVTFTGLRPGREYIVTVITSSGPFNVTSDNVQGITVPSTPGSIRVTNFNTSSISLDWGEPADMDFGSYTFNVTYQDGSSTKSMTADINSTTILNLISGTEHTISVATIGPGQLQSKFVSTAHFTKPNPVKNLQIVQIGTTDITVRWQRPDQHKAEYQYRVLTDGSPAPTGSNGNQTVTNENATVTGLTSGTNYTFSVITLAKNDTQADPVVVANYTEPVKIPLENISLSNENTTNSLKVSWIHPPGGVEKFVIDIEDSLNPTAYMNKRTVQSSTNSVEFDSLRPGRLYSVKVTTVSGSHYITSNSVEKATLPSRPGAIVVTNVTNSTIQFGWGRPDDMDIGGYKFIVTYQVAQVANIISSTEDNNKSTITYLESGTNYIITVTTISQNLSSAEVTISRYTQPNAISNLHVVSTSTTSINLAWVQPPGYKSEYKYKVQTDGKPSSNEIVNTEFITINGLTPGDKFAFTVFTQAADNTKGNSVTLVHCMNAAAISSSSLKCKGMDLNPILNLEWKCPIGVNSGFLIHAILNSSIEIAEKSMNCTPDQQQQFNLSKVAFFTNYIVNITTLSCGLSSTPTSIDCKSGITRPAQPSAKLDLGNYEITHNTIKFTIKDDVFSSNNGPILAIAVIVTKEQGDNIPDGKAIETAYNSAAPAYVTQIIQLQTQTQNTRAIALSGPTSVTIGNGSKSLGYVNQELTPLTAYKISLAGFTKMEMEQDIIVSNRSFYTAYHYSDKITLNQNPGVIIGAVVGCILGAIVIAALVLLLIWRKKRAINVDYFVGYFSKQHADSDCGFAEEYEELKTVGILQSTQVSQQPLNKPKNRYNNVLPYDASRVKLSPTAEPASDYINANFMPGYNTKREFVAAQGPLMNTVSDFWRMIWEHHVPAIVMLTKCVEQGRAKCEQYWPTERPLIFEDKIVTLTSEITLPDWTIRDFTIVKDKSGEKRSLRQFHFTGWPDHGVPSTTAVLIEFRNLVRQYINQHPMSGPTVVHCSAGVGRTGTFISIDHMIYQIDGNKKVDIWGIVYQLRMNRPLMVQTESQYVFLNQCAMEYIKSNKEQTNDAIYENTPALIYENTSAIRAAQVSNGHAL
uniref:receptor-type tyrosine-protein phosphatase eta isoform X2 n=1 Tax=Pristiophorus japonicus TaxID=55135 RepID=UPI00398F8DD5